MLTMMWLLCCMSGRDLNDGTTRSCRHLPGYTGFIPAAAVNGAAVQQAAGTSTRADAKVGRLRHFV